MGEMLLEIEWDRETAPPPPLSSSHGERLSVCITFNQFAFRRFMCETDIREYGKHSHESKEKKRGNILCGIVSYS